MAEYIKREDVLREYDKEQRRNGPWRFETLIESIPSADVAPVVHGRWVIVDDGVMIGDGKHMECSFCHTWQKDRIKTNYCHNCGTRMDLEVGT